MSEISKEAMKQEFPRLSALKFFPANPAALAVVAEILENSCRSDADLKHLVKTVLEEMDEYPGPKSLREYTDEWRRRRLGPSREGKDPYREWIPPWEAKDRKDAA